MNTSPIHYKWLDISDATEILKQHLPGDKIQAYTKELKYELHSVRVLLKYSHKYSKVLVPVKASSDKVPLARITEAEVLKIGKMFFEADRKRVKQIKEYHAYQIEHENCWMVSVSDKEGNSLADSVVIDYQTGLIFWKENEWKYDIGYEFIVYKAYKLIEGKYSIPKYYTLD